MLSASSLSTQHPLCEDEPEDTKEPTLGECSKAFAQVSHYAEIIGEGDGFNATCDLKVAQELFAAINLASGCFDQLKAVSKSQLETEIDFHLNAFERYEKIRDASE